MKHEFGCMNCGSVIKLEGTAAPSQFSMKVKQGGKFKNNPQGTKVVCDKCHKVVAQIRIDRT